MVVFIVAFNEFSFKVSTDCGKDVSQVPYCRGRQYNPALFYYKHQVDMYGEYTTCLSPALTPILDRYRLIAGEETGMP